MLFTGLKIAISFFLFALVLVVIAKVVWVNLTPGHYREAGCCKYSYLTDEEYKIVSEQTYICPKACKVMDTTEYKINLLFNNLDFNKGQAFFSDENK